MSALAKVALYGDPTTTGGRIISGSPLMSDNGMPVATKGDKTTCPACKQTGVIIEGTEHFKVGGQPIAYHGCIIVCGCKPIGVNRIIAYESMIDVCIPSAAERKTSPAPANNLNRSQSSSPQAGFVGGQSTTTSRRDDARNESNSRLLGEGNVRYREVKENYHFSQVAGVADWLPPLGSFEFRGDYTVDRTGKLSVSAMGFTPAIRLGKVEFQLVAHIYVNGREVMHKRLEMGDGSSAWPADDHFVPVGSTEIPLPAARSDFRVQLCLKGTYYFMSPGSNNTPTATAIEYFELRTETF